MISFCLIVKDEEKWITDCMKSLYPLADEIIMADTGSKDRTPEIAKTFLKTTLFQIPWQNDFGSARNQTIERATEPWIFSFDADERIAAKDIETFRKVIAEADADPQVEALSLIRRDYVLNPSVSGFKPNTGEYPDEERMSPGYYEERMVRIFRRKPHIRWVGALHEMVDSTLKGRTLHTNLIFHHFGYLPDEMDRKRKRDFYEREGQRKTAENPNDWKAHFDLAVEYVGAQNFKDAIPLFERAEALGGPIHLTLSNRGYAQMALGMLKEAETTLRRCVQVVPQFHDGLLNLGCVLMRMDRWPEATECFTNLLASHPKSFLGCRNLGLCYAHLNNFAKAAQCFRTAIEIFPGYVDAKLDLATIELHSMKIDSAKQLTLKALGDDPKSDRGLAILKHINSVQARTGHPAR